MHKASQRHQKRPGKSAGAPIFFDLPQEFDDDAVASQQNGGRAVDDVDVFPEAIPHRPPQRRKVSNEHRREHDPERVLPYDVFDLSRVDYATPLKKPIVITFFAWAPSRSSRIQGRM